MRKEEPQQFRFSVYSDHKLQYFWNLTMKGGKIVISELGLGNAHNKLPATFKLPTFKNPCIKEEDAKSYIAGQVDFKYDCFKALCNVQNVKLVIPQDYSYRFERGEFTNLKISGKKVTFVIPENDDLFEVTQGNKSWLLVADSKLAKLSGNDGCTIESCSNPAIKNRLKELYDYSINIERVKKEELKDYEQQ